ncbi:MAG: T9SS type A sorting domain-containing protein [Flavobacteriaceae bacterium]|nr:T9SS type A sorting domain-containing protein [Flavobacteriaceae bacterium]
MKKEITFSLIGCLLTVLTFGQVLSDDLVGHQGIEIPERTEALQQLFDQAKYLENYGTAQEIEQNRLAIKNEWATISPEVAALYKPLDANVNTTADFVLSANSYPPDSEPVDNFWGDEDLLLREGFVDGWDIDAAGSQGLFVAGFENNGGESEFFIYRSNDNGGSFFLWADAVLNDDIAKGKIISLNGNGNEYLLAYVLLENGQFSVMQWNIHNGNLVDTANITFGVVDFAVDQNYPVGTDTRRVFATYLKESLACDSILYSARSTAGSYGMEWVDEHNFFLCIDEIDISYGRNGAIYATYIGLSTRDLYANVNSNFNDPTSWDGDEVVANGDSQESRNPIIAATRNTLGSDKVILITRSRDAGSSDGFSHRRYNRESGGDYFLDQEGLPLPNNSIGPMDAWVRRESGNEIIRTSYIREFLDDSFNDRAQSYTYDGDVLLDNEVANDVDFEIWNGLAPATAETPVGYAACMVFARDSGSRGLGLYFNRDTEILSTNDPSTEAIQYYPNPTQGILQIDASQEMERISIYSVNGQVVKEFTQLPANASLDLHDLPVGMYLMTVQNRESNTTYKIIKQ